MSTQENLGVLFIDGWSHGYCMAVRGVLDSRALICGINWVHIIKVITINVRYYVDIV